jgi:hypothetical protein
MKKARGKHIKSKQNILKVVIGCRRHCPEISPFGIWRILSQRNLREKQKQVSLTIFNVFF